MNNISTHITYEQAIYSETAIRKKIINIPNDEQLIAMKVVAKECFEKIKEHFPDASVTSFYRCQQLNSAIGGSKTSQHMKGEAIDIGRGSREKNKELYEWCKLNLIFDQLIYEFGNDSGPDWVHISFTAKNKNRNQFFRI